MKILLDTQALILAGKNSLPSLSEKLYLDSNNEIFFSPVSLWEMAIKRSLGKLTFKLSINDYEDLLVKEGLSKINIESTHLEALSKLQWIHKDPFDRTLIAQAIIEQMTIMTGDTVFRKYPCLSLWS